jgi:hypothetical protein
MQVPGFDPRHCKKINFFLLAVLGVELRASLLLGRCSITWAMPSTLFALVFGMGSCVFAQASLDCDPTIYTLHIAGMTGAGHQAQHYWLR